MRSPVLLLAALLTAPARADSLSEAFSRGAALGQAGASTAAGRIRGASPQASVPAYTDHPPAAAYFGSPGLGAAAATTLSTCKGAGNPGGQGAQGCEAMNFSQANPAARARFSIAPGDPLLATSRAIADNPTAIAGNLAGSYSGCTTRTTPGAPIVQDTTCNQYVPLAQPLCSRTLSVSVVDDGLPCAYGSWITGASLLAPIRPATFVGATCADDIRFTWYYTYSECDGTDAYQFSSTTLSTDAQQELVVNLGCGGQYYLAGSCPGGNCSYTVGRPSARGNIPLASFRFQRPRRTYTITDHWDDQCAAFEARLP